MVGNLYNYFNLYIYIFVTADDSWQRSWSLIFTGEARQWNPVFSKWTNVCIVHQLSAVW